MKLETSTQTNRQLPELSKKKGFWNRGGYLLLCMLLPAAIMYLIYFARGIYPFGNGCVMVLDLNGQYVWFFEALRNFVKGDASLLYSFCRALGGEFLGIYAYYLASPLSYLVCLFPTDRMLEALLVLFLLKTAICGGTFGFYMKKTMKEPKPLAIVAFSVLYALSAYAVVQQHNTMWIDAVMWLPLITLGIEELIRHGKFRMYSFFLALTVFSNFYIGYMVCIYCFVYFFIYYFAHNDQFRNNPLGEHAHFIKSLVRIAFHSLLAIGTAAVILLAAYYSLNFGKTTFSNPSWDVEQNFTLLELFYKFLPGSYDTVRPAGLPFVYCGVLTLLMLPAYFLSKKYPLRQKIFSGILIFIFVASMSLSVTDLIWHGFQKPNWLNYRYSFMLCFYLCVLACRAFADFEKISLRTVLGTAGLIALFCVVLQNYTDDAYVEPNTYTCIWFTLIALFVYLAVLAFLRNTDNKQLAAITLVSVISVEALLNGLTNLNDLDNDVTYTKYSYYNNFLNGARPLVEAVQSEDTSFYRMEKTYFRKTNDNMALNIRGLSGSTSTLNKETIQFLNKMGYSSKSHWSKYLGGTPVNDSLLGIKYILSDDDSYSQYYDVFKTDEANGYTAYLNPYALSIAYGVDEALLQFPLGYTNVQPDSSQTTTDEDDQVNAKQISVWVNQLKQSLNELFGIDETINSSEYVDEYNSPFERLNAIITAMLGEEETVEVFVPIQKGTDITTNLSKSYVAGHQRYTLNNEELSGILTYNITMPEDAELFFYLPTRYAREVELNLTNSTESTRKDCGTFNGNETSRIISLGMQSAGDRLSLDMTLTTENLYVLSGQEAFYYIDWEVFEDAMARLAQDQYHVTSYTEDSLSGTFTASRPNELVMTTIAYDKGWTVLVDGKEVELEKALGSVIAFHVDGSAGQEHTVEMIYEPNTLHVGLIITTVCGSLMLLLMVLEPWLKKVPGLRVLFCATGNRNPQEDAPVLATDDDRTVTVYDFDQQKE